MNPPQKRKADKAQKVLEKLIKGILSGEFRPGMPLREVVLARQWKVSRTPLRQAIGHAAEAGFISLRPNRRPVVRLLDAQAVRDLYEVREMLELKALDQAWGKWSRKEIAELKKHFAGAKPRQQKDWVERCLVVDLKLHQLWAKHCQNQWIKADLERYYRYLGIFLTWMGQDEISVERAFEEHEMIFRTITDGDHSATRKALREHVRSSADLIIKALQDIENGRPA